jgi:nicotinamide-nucleotide amidase
VSAEVAAQMARGVAALFGADVGVATTGFAETKGSPNGLRSEGQKPDTVEQAAQPFAFWAVACRLPGGGGWGTRAGRVVCLGADRRAAQALITDAVLAELLAHLRTTRPVGA